MKLAGLHHRVQQHHEMTSTKKSFFFHFISFFRRRRKFVLSVSWIREDWTQLENGTKRLTDSTTCQLSLCYCQLIVYSRTPEIPSLNSGRLLVLTKKEANNPKSNESKFEICLMTFQQQPSCRIMFPHILPCRRHHDQDKQSRIGIVHLIDGLLKI